MSLDGLGDRMKRYEAAETGRLFLPMLPVIARIDGRAFHSFTRGMERPFDVRMVQAMVATTGQLIERTHARIGYTQSDEINLVWHAEEYGSEIFFNGRIFKMTSVLAALATVCFHRELVYFGHEEARYTARLPHFDARVFQVPNRDEAANLFLWRNQDATKNALSMAASAYYSHRELHGQNSTAKHEMLFAKGINFDRYPEAFKRGTWVRRGTVKRALTEAEVARIPVAHRPPPGSVVTRSETQVVPMPPFGQVINRIEVIFDGAEPAEAASGELEK